MFSINHGFIYLVFGATCMAFLNITLKISKKKGRNISASITANYVTALLLCSFLFLIDGIIFLPPSITYLPPLFGMLFLLGITFQAVSLDQKGVALTSSIVQLAIIIPTIMSIFLWSESTNITQTTGIVLAMFSLILLNIKGSKSDDVSRSEVLTTIALFVITGFGMSSGKVLIETGYVDAWIPYFLVLYGSAFLFSIPLMALNKNKPSRADIGYGSMLGFFNTGSNFCLVKALSTIPGSMVFPFYSSVGLLITVVLSIVLMNEKINKLNTVGIATCIAAVMLINT